MVFNYKLTPTDQSTIFHLVNICIDDSIETVDKEYVNSIYGRYLPSLLNIINLAISKDRILKEIDDLRRIKEEKALSFYLDIRNRIIELRDLLKEYEMIDICIRDNEKDIYPFVITEIGRMDCLDDSGDLLIKANADNIYKLTISFKPEERMHMLENIIDEYNSSSLVNRELKEFFRRAK